MARALGSPTVKVTELVKVAPLLGQAYRVGKANVLLEVASLLGQTIYRWTERKPGPANCTRP